MGIPLLWPMYHILPHSIQYRLDVCCIFSMVNHELLSCRSATRVAKLTQVCCKSIFRRGGAERAIAIREMYVIMNTRRWSALLLELRVAVWATSITERRVPDLVFLPDPVTLMSYFLKTAFMFVNANQVNAIRNSSNNAMPNADMGA